MLKFSLLGNTFPDFFIEVKIWYRNTFKFVLRRFLERQNKFQHKYGCF